MRRPPSRRTSYAKAEQRLSAVAAACGTAVRGEGDVVWIALDATTRGTLPAAHRARRKIRKMAMGLREETIRALTAARQGATNDAWHTVRDSSA